MSRQIGQRYGDVAVLFHWIIALLIIGLLAIGKYMTGLENNDPARFFLTQWHKSFGITLLVLSLLRLLWRWTHRPPPEPGTMPTWQIFVANVVHWVLYALLFIMPVTGWLMVSVSPLNIDTVLFDVVTLPHLPFFESYPDKEHLEHTFHHYHHLAGNVLIVLLLAHIGAALKHHFIDKDSVLVRILPDWQSRSLKVKFAGLIAVVLGFVAALTLYASNGNQTALLAAGDSEVSFIADVTGAQTPGIFAISTVEAVIDENNPANSTITARVQTASVSSENSQVEGSLPDTEWFDVENYPEAVFQSTAFRATDDGNLLVDGDLTMKSTTKSVSFPILIISEEGGKVARGQFVVDRREFDIGMNSNPDDDYLGFDVTIQFRFDINVTSP